MDKIAVRLEADATPSAPALILRPWSPTDAADLVELYQDDALRRWTSSAVHDEASAARWIQDQQRGWETGDRFGFAITEAQAAGLEGRLAGHVVLKERHPGRFVRRGRLLDRSACARPGSGTRSAAGGDVLGLHRLPR